MDSVNGVLGMAGQKVPAASSGIEPSSGFEEFVSDALNPISESPPGHEPPPGSKDNPGEEAETVEPNAPSQKPDFPQKQDPAPSSPSSLAALAWGPSFYQPDAPLSGAESAWASTEAAGLAQLDGLASIEGTVTGFQRIANLHSSTEITGQDAFEKSQVPHDTPTMNDPGLAEGSWTSAQQSGFEQLEALEGIDSRTPLDDFRGSFRSIELAIDTNDLGTPNESVRNALAADSLGITTAKRSVPEILPSSGNTVADLGNLPESNTHAILRQVSDRIALLATTRRKEAITIHLEPRDLGAIVVSIHKTGQQVEATLSASQADVRSALQQNAATLGQNLEAKGLHLASVTIDASLTDTGSNVDPQARNTPDQAASGSPNRSHGTESLGTVRHEAAWGSIGASSGIDIWI